MLRAVHEEQLAEHGGAPGPTRTSLRPACPQNLATYGKPDVFELAACYAVALAKNHPFIDGNKRTAFVAIELFLVLNGQELLADDPGCVLTLLGVAAGSITEPELAEWLRRHCERR
jgi:death on curing protein